jgi:hypothetical protein
MRSALRWRYYCDFCKKAGGLAYHIQRHETYCTLNPDRKCRMCDGMGGDVADNRAALASGGLNAVRESAENCPACILAAIRQTPGLSVGEFEDFDFGSEGKSFLNAKHREDWPY